MATIHSVCGKYSVEIHQANSDGTLMACAMVNDGQTYGGSSYWFTIGCYKSLALAVKRSIMKMALHNIELEEFSAT